MERLLFEEYNRSAAQVIRYICTLLVHLKLFFFADGSRNVAVASGDSWDKRITYYNNYICIIVSVNNSLVFVLK